MKSENEELIEEVASHMYGTIYESLLLIINEEKISEFVRTPDAMTAREKCNFLEGIRPTCEKLMNYYRIHSPGEWERFSRTLPEWKELIRRKKRLKLLWRSRPRNPYAPWRR